MLIAKEGFTYLILFILQKSFPVLFKGFNSLSLHILTCLDSDIAKVPRLGGIACYFGCFGEIAYNKSESVAVIKKPRAFGGICNRSHTADRPADVQCIACMMLTVASSCTEFVSLFLAFKNLSGLLERLFFRFDLGQFILFLLSFFSFKLCFLRFCLLNSLRLCTDNGAMIASAGYFEYINGTRNGLDLNACPSLKL